MKHFSAAQSPLRAHLLHSGAGARGARTGTRDTPGCTSAPESPSTAISRSACRPFPCPAESMLLFPPALSRPVAHCRDQISRLAAPAPRMRTRTLPLKSESGAEKARHHATERRRRMADRTAAETRPAVSHPRARDAALYMSTFNSPNGINRRSKMAKAKHLRAFPDVFRGRRCVRSSSSPPRSESHARQLCASPICTSSCSAQVSVVRRVKSILANTSLAIYQHSGQCSCF